MAVTRSRGSNKAPACIPAASLATEEKPGGMRFIARTQSHGDADVTNGIEMSPRGRRLGFPRPRAQWKAGHKTTYLLCETRKPDVPAQWHTCVNCMLHRRRGREACGHLASGVSRRRAGVAGQPEVLGRDRPQRKASLLRETVSAGIPGVTECAWQEVTAGHIMTFLWV